MKASTGALLAAMAVLAALAATALATDYTVGGADLWDTFVNYDKWAAGKTFMVGDTITFKYEPYHNVLEVTEADYETCTVGKPISTHSGGNTTFELTDTGTRYFICGIPRHCLNGTMHIKVTTVPYDAVAAASPSPTPFPSPPADSFAQSPAAMDIAGKSPTGAPSNTARYQQPTAAAVAGLVLAALVALAA